MYLDIFDVLIFTVLAFFALLWWQRQTVRQRAIAHAQRRCKELDLQFLDGGMALSFAGFRRGPNGQLGIMRHCRFEFSATGEDRYQGEVLMLGATLIEIRLPPHRMRDV